MASAGKAWLRTSGAWAPTGLLDRWLRGRRLDRGPQLLAPSLRAERAEGRRSPVVSARHASSPECRARSGTRSSWPCVAGAGTASARRFSSSLDRRARWPTYGCPRDAQETSKRRPRETRAAGGAWEEQLARRLAIATLALCALFGQPAAAEDWPSRTVKIIVPFAAGATPDIIARMIAEKLQQTLNQTFIVENKPGASG